LVALLLAGFLSGCEVVNSQTEGPAGGQDALGDDVRSSLLALLRARDPTIRDLSTVAACDASRLLRENLAQTPLFMTTSAGRCLPADLEGPDAGLYFSDGFCTNPVAYRPPSFTRFCEEMLASAPNALLGNASTWDRDRLQFNDPLPDQPSQRWTLALGADFRLGLEPIDGNALPFMKRFRYKGVASDRGICELEMRVYKRAIPDSNLPPLLALHGGSWAFRDGAFLGLESQISHYTQQGFIVFAPFYRLAGEQDGNRACNGVTSQAITQDVSDALTWVQQFGPALGATPGPVRVMGQSAGGFLAAWLALNRPSDVTRGLLLYPPTDALDFARNARPGGAYAEYQASLDTLERFLGIPDLTVIDLDNPPVAVTESALVRRASPGSPPFFILHGNADTVVPSQQSVLLCNAYGGGAENDGGDPATGTFTRSYLCGTGELHLFAQGEHALDLLCLPDVICRAGSPTSAEFVAAALRRGRVWLAGF
jgi:acetyl esterase/lipase